MSLLPMKDLIRFSTVSNMFLSAYHSSPIINFDFESFTDRSTNSFSAFVSSKLARLRFPMNNIANTTAACNFQRLSFVGPIINTNLVDEMVGFADDNKIKELNLHVEPNSEFCKLTNKVFSFDHITSLKIRGLELDRDDLILCCSSIQEFSLGHCSKLRMIELKGAELKHVVIDSCSALKKVDIHPQVRLESFSFTCANRKHTEINLNNQKYSLKYLELRTNTRLRTNIPIVNDDWFQDYISVCNLLETLKLERCQELKNIYLKSDSLKTLELENCVGLENVDVMAPNLETFILVYGNRIAYKRRKINIGNSMNLKHLKLRKVEVTDQWFKDNLYLFHYLENLELERCCDLREINIYDTMHLRSFNLLECRDLTKFEIDAPKLASFTYKGKILSSFPVIKARRLDAKLFFSEPDGCIDDSHRRLFKEFMVSFGHCETLFINCTYEVCYYLIN